MPLTIGSRLGPYAIVDKLGEGGMGEAYRARDTNLSEPDRLMRFTREAKTLASLNHPNIAGIYGIEDRALVMELVEGEDLSGHIATRRIAGRQRHHQR
ncbi:MAG: hypothetical protein HQ485_09950 [Acidobacteria bacterium]|nr:hypothetical protein [Acidobacteriota bacterium]